MTDCLSMVYLTKMLNVWNNRILSGAQPEPGDLRIFCVAGRKSADPLPRLACSGGQVFLIHIVQYLCVRHQHSFGHFIAGFAHNLGIGNHSAYQIHSQRLWPFLLRKVVLTVGLEKFVVGTLVALFVVMRLTISNVG